MRDVMSYQRAWESDKNSDPRPYIRALRRNSMSDLDREVEILEEFMNKRRDEIAAKLIIEVFHEWEELYDETVDDFVDKINQTFVNESMFAEAWDDPDTAMVNIDGTLYLIENLSGKDGDSYYVTSEGEDFLFEKDEDSIKSRIRERYENESASELVHIIGADRLVAWGMGRRDNWGISSFDEFIEALSNEAGSELAGYDGEQRNVHACSQSLKDTLGFTPEYAFRVN